MSVSTQLAEKHGIVTQPGRKGKCPFCGHGTFSVKRDDSIGKCFHPACGRFIISESRKRGSENSLDQLMEDIFQDFHASLLAQATLTGHENAYSYLVSKRRIHPRVVADSMLGAVPSRYDCALKFEIAILAAEAAVKATKSESGLARNDMVRSAERDLEFLIEARDKFRTCTRGRAGWIASFYTDASHRIVAIRFRKPYSKRFVYFKPYEAVAGLFGHGLFTPDLTENGTAIDDFLIVTEGEFNQLQLQSLSLRYGETTGHRTGYVFACAVGGVSKPDYGCIRKTSPHPVFCYDNDSNGAGLALVNRAMEIMSVSAFTTPNPDSDLDKFITGYGEDHISAWEAVRALVAGRKTLPRIYSGNGTEFFREKTFIPKRLAEAIMEQCQFKYAAGTLWVYRNGVYRNDGEQVVRSEAQKLLGDERRENRILETLHYIETDNRTDTPSPSLHYVNVRNGRLDWLHRKLEPHSPDYFETVQLPVLYDPCAVCPQFDHYLQTTLAPEIIPLAEEIMGYCLLPDTRFEKAVMLVGHGSNGKSVFLGNLVALLGADNVATVALQDLEENRFRVAELFGRLANIFADLDDRALKSSSIFKTLVSGDRITGERKFSQPFSFCSYARLVFSANTLPPCRDRTHAFYRRWLIIPFDRTFDGVSADKRLPAKLNKELPGILNRVLNGLQRLVSQEGFSEPAAVKSALGEYQRENDTVASFIEECVAEDPGATIEKKMFYGAYLTWCESQGLRQVSQKKLKSSLQNAFPRLDEIRSQAGLGPWRWVGIKLIEDAPNLCEGNARFDAKVMQRLK